MPENDLFPILLIMIAQLVFIVTQLNRLESQNEGLRDLVRHFAEAAGWSDYLPRVYPKRKFLGYNKSEWIMIGLYVIFVTGGIYYVWITPK